MPSPHCIPQICSHGTLVLAGIFIGAALGEIHCPRVQSEEHSRHFSPLELSRNNLNRPTRPNTNRDCPEVVAAALVRMLRTPGGESLEDMRRIGNKLLGQTPKTIVRTNPFSTVPEPEMQSLLLLTARAVALANSAKSLEWLDALVPFCNSDTHRDQLLWTSCELAATEHPQLVWDAMMLLAPTESRDKLQGLSLASLLTYHDRSQNLFLTDQRTATAFDAEFSNSFAVAVASGSLDTAQQILVQLPDGILREKLAGQLAASIANHDPEQLVQWLASLPDSLKTTGLLGEIPVEVLAKGSFDAVSNWIQAASGYAGSEAWSSALIAEWVGQDPTTASALLLDSETSLPNKTQAILAITLARIHPTNAAHWHASLDSDLQTLTAGHLARHKLAESFNAAESFVASIKDPVARDSAKKHLAWHLANNDLGKTIQYLTSNPEAATLGTVSLVTDHLIESNPEATLSWLHQLPAAWQPGLFNQAATSFAQKDYPATIRWAESIADPSNRDGAFAAIANHVAAEQPAEALRWVEKIQNPHEQAALLRQKFQRWSLNDHASAAHWLEDKGENHPHSLAELQTIQEQSRIFLISKRNK